MKYMNYMETTYESVYNEDVALSQLPVNEMLEIGLVTDGHGVHRILNEETECHEGDVFILNSGVAHEYFAKSEEEKPTVCRLRFHVGDWLEGDCADYNSPRFCHGVFRDNVPISYSVLNSKAFSEVLKMFLSIEAELTAKETEWESAVQAHLKLLLITLGRYVNLADTATREVKPKEWSIVSAAMHEVLEHCDDCDLTLESIAASLYISKSYLSRLFQKVVGESFVNYIRNVRISQACKLLQYTSLKNEEIVGRCGLRDIPSFYRVFKSVMGMTPYQYRMSQTSFEKTSRGVNVMSILNEISENLQKGKAKLVKELVENAVAEGMPAVQILNEGLLSGMNLIGERFKNNEVYVPEVLVAARAMNMGMQVLKPLLIEDGVQAKGRVCIGTVQGDLHDIGKNLVKMMMEGKGLEVIDLGTDVAPETFVKAAVEQECQVICCSALLTTTMDVMASVVKAAEEAGIRDKVKIMVGGAPVTEEFCASIGADCYTSDAASAADAAVELCGQ